MALPTRKASIKPPIITLGGVAGTGKSTLAALFTPGKTLWIPIEDTDATFSTWDESMQPDFLPALPVADKRKQVSTRKALLATLREIRTQPHDYDGGTLVIDSVSVLQKMFEAELCDKEDKDNVEDCANGFQKCYKVIGMWHQQVMDECIKIRNERNMTIVFTSHVTARKIRQKPDAEEHTMWDLDMAVVCAAFYIDKSDCVLYLRMEEFIRGREVNNKNVVVKLGKVVPTGKHIMVTTSEGNMGFGNAKNRYGLPPKIEIPLFENPLLNLIPFFSGQQPVTEEQ